MESVFHTLDCINNQSKCFWQEICTPIDEDIISSTRFGGSLQVNHNSKGIKFKRFVLTNTRIYMLSKWRIPKKQANINWKTTEAFIEKFKNKTRFGFRLTGKSWETFYTSSSSELDKWIEHLSKVCILPSFEEDFIVIKEIKKGSGGTVKLCKSSLDMADYAVKVVKKSSFADQPVIFQNTVNEISILRQLSHPNIVKLIRVYESNTEVLLVLEYLQGGDMQKSLRQVQKYSEDETLRFMSKLFVVLNYIHSKNFVHRDIKLENIVFSSDNIEEFKIVDFGLACKYENGLRQQCGTPGWVAPEILKGHFYDFKADMFSAGVLMHAMLTGKLPFQGKNLKEVLKKNLEADLRNENMELKTVNTCSVQLLQGLLEKNPFLRVGSIDALNLKVIKDILGDELVFRITAKSDEDREKSMIEKKIASDTEIVSQLLQRLDM